MAVAGKCQLHGVDNVGTVPAAVTAYLAVHEFKPDLVISVGTAGGFKSKGAAIGDVFLATAFANHDRRIPIPVGLIASLACCKYAQSKRRHLRPKTIDALTAKHFDALTKPSSCCRALTNMVSGG